MAAGQAAPFVAEVLVSPMDATAAELAALAAVGLTKVRILPPGDTGIYSAWNKLIAACGTSHIAFHGIDDLVEANPAIGAALASLGPREMLVTSVRFASPRGESIAVYHHRETEPPALSLGRYANPAGPEVAWPVTELRAVGGLDESFRIAGDVDLYFRVRPRVRRVDSEAIMLTMLDGGVSVRASYSGIVWAENRRIAYTNGQNVPFQNQLISGLFLKGRRLLCRIGGERFADVLTDWLRWLAGRSARYSMFNMKECCQSTSRSHPTS